MQPPRPKPVASAFAGRTARALLVPAVVAVVTFSALSHRLLRAQNRRLLSQEARLCAAALVPGRGGDLSESVTRLQARYQGLIAVATLDSSGDVNTVYPDRPAHRAAVLAARKRPTRLVTMRAPGGGEPSTAMGIVVPLNGSPSAAARKALILLRADSYTPDWVKATAILACIMSVCALLSAQALAHWFTERVVDPMRRTSRALADHLKDPQRNPIPPPGEWCETAELAAHCRELVRRAEASNTRARRVEEEAEHRVRKHLLGFDRRLRRAKDRATLDPLTKLRNRTFLDERLEPLFRTCRAKGEELAAVMIDIDNFKRYNDSRGHPAGDALLRFVGDLLRACVRPTDHAIRYGGDEFLLLLPDATAAQAEAIAERMVKLFTQHATCLRGRHNLSLSAGVGSLDVDAPESGDALVVCADAALYAAKRKGKNTVAGHRMP